MLPHLDGQRDPADQVPQLLPDDAAARIAFDRCAWHMVLTLWITMPHETAMPPPLCADNDGFSLNAAVPVEGHDRWRQVPLRLCIRRPALPDERVQRNAAGQIEPKRKRPWRDGTTQLVMGLQEFE